MPSGPAARWPLQPPYQQQPVPRLERDENRRNRLPEIHRRGQHFIIAISVYHRNSRFNLAFKYSYYFWNFATCTWQHENRKREKSAPFIITEAVDHFRYRVLHPSENPYYNQWRCLYCTNNLLFTSCLWRDSFAYRTKQIVLNKMPAFWMVFCRFCLSWMPLIGHLHWCADVFDWLQFSEKLFTQIPFAQECLKAGIYQWVPNRPDTWFYQYCKNGNVIYFF